MRENMGGDGHNDDGDRGISSQDIQTGCGDDSEEGQWRGMGMCLSGRVIGDHGDLADKGVHEELSVSNSRICSRETNIQIFYQRRKDGGFQQVTNMVVLETRIQSDGEGGRVKQRTVYSVKNNQQQLLRCLQEGRGYDSHPIIYQTLNSGSIIYTTT